MKFFLWGNKLFHLMQCVSIRQCENTQFEAVATTKWCQPITIDAINDFLRLVNNTQDDTEKHFATMLFLFYIFKSLVFVSRI